MALSSLAGDWGHTGFEFHCSLGESGIPNLIQRPDAVTHQISNSLNLGQNQSQPSESMQGPSQGLSPR